MLRTIATFFIFASAALAPIELATAQVVTIHSAFDNPTYADNVSMGGPNLLFAIKTQMPVTGVATRVEIFTGERTGLNTIALWDHDAAANAPGTALGDGSWQMCTRNGWQGALLTTPVVLLQGQTFWVVWGPQNGAQASAANIGPGAQEYRGSFNGGASWNGPFSSRQWKFRIWTGVAGHYEIYGQGCVGSAGIPRLCWSGMPLTGSSFDLHLSDVPSGALAILTFGFSDSMSGQQTLPFDLGGFGAPGCQVLAEQLVNTFTTVGPSGTAVVPATFPANPGLVGLQLVNQYYCLDPAANTLGLTASNAGRAVIGG